MNSPATVVYDNLSEFTRECLGIADEAVTKLAAVERQLEAAETKHREALVLTKVASDEEIPLVKVAGTVDRLIATGFVKRANRLDTITGIRSAPRHELFAILEKLASIAVCPVSSLHRDDDGEAVEKAAGKTTDGSSKFDAVWNEAWEQAGAEVGA